jgi:hypothetical protein
MTGSNTKSVETSEYNGPDGELVSCLVVHQVSWSVGQLVSHHLAVKLVTHLDLYVVYTHTNC